MITEIGTALDVVANIFSNRIRPKQPRMIGYIVQGIKKEWAEKTAQPFVRRNI